MLVSTRGRYALRVMVDLAQHQSQGPIPMKDVAQRQQISLKYLEKILPVLSKNGYIVGTHGKGGGDQLTRAPEEYRVGDILRLTEGDLAPVACLEAEENTCERQGICPTLGFWTGLYAAINDYVDRFTLADLVREELAKSGAPSAPPET